MARRKRLSLNDLVREVDAWLKEEPASPNHDLLAEMLYLVLDLARRDFDRGDLKVLVRSLREERRAFRLFAPYRSVRKVSIFGSARVAETDPYYALARDFAQLIAAEGILPFLSGRTSSPPWKSISLSAFSVRNAAASAVTLGRASKLTLGGGAGG